VLFLVDGTTLYHACPVHRDSHVFVSHRWPFCVQDVRPVYSLQRGSDLPPPPLLRQAVPLQTHHQPARKLREVGRRSPTASMGQS